MSGERKIRIPRNIDVRDLDIDELEDEAGEAEFEETHEKRTGSGKKFVVRDPNSR